MGRAVKSGSRVPHLQQRQGTYHLRVRVPDDLRVRIGLREVRRSLLVHTFAEARPLALKYAARVMEVFEMAKSAELTKDKIRGLILNRFAELPNEDDGDHQCLTKRPDGELYELEGLATESIAVVQTQRATGDYRHPVVGEVIQLLERAGTRLRVSSASRPSAVARALS